MATVTSVSGSKVTYRLATTAQPVSAAVLAKSVQARVGAELGAAITSVTCGGALQPAVKSSTQCILTSGTATRNVAVSVTSIDGGVITYSIGLA